ncbi:hypothetical protein FRC98_03905 [Lujinxingia vulgaris]|uniref:Uncharacterized protein n=1 Tax=Lujinxingia vulgaris TaxID=2600176 RepID=A0A5C6X856_9DELT|nr:hypothetical protein [Lujinxingia vulgaris]TXD38052.1 hypothetical protein FRC98_03905 [Lujinxingia vulgaris]
MAKSKTRTWAAALAAMVLIFGSGCGPEEEVPLCRSDYECDPGLVCEPSGCRTACEEDADCRLGQRCVLRRVEEGRVCGRAS